MIRYHGQTGTLIDTFVQDHRRGGFVAFAFGPDGHLYASEFNRGQSVRRYDGSNGQYIDTFTQGHRAHGSVLSGSVFGSDGMLYASRFHADCIQHFDGATGAFLGKLVKIGSGGLDVPDYLVLGPDGHLYDGATGRFVDRFAKRVGMVPKGLAFLDDPSAR